MGGAFGGVADDVHAIYYNPAGLGYLEGVQAAAMHNAHFQDISHNFGAMAVPVLSWVDTRRRRNALGVMAFSLTSLSVDDIQRRGLVETDQPTGTFEAQDLAYTLGYGLALFERWAVGVSGKFITQSIDSANARAVLKKALDSDNPCRLGIALHSYADTWSHQNFSGLQEPWNSVYPWYNIFKSIAPNIGHAEAGHLPDAPTSRARPCPAHSF